MSESPLHEQTAIDQVESSPELRHPELGPGAQLGAHRQALGLTVEQVANQLNLAPRQIQALEADNYAALPGVVIARGFIRAYAKLLKIDPTPLVRLMPGDVVPMESIQLRRALSGSLSESRLPAAMRKGRLPRWGMAAGLLVLVVVGISVVQWLGLFPGISESVSESVEKGATIFAPSTNVSSTPGGSPQEAVGTSRITKDEIATPMPAPAQSNGSPAVNSSVPATTVGLPTPAGPTPSVKSTLPAMAPAAAPVTPSTTQQPVAPVVSPVVTSAASENVNVANKNSLVIKLREDSWVEVKSADNSIAVSRLMKAGTSETFLVTKPVSLTIGNATGVELILRGRAIDLTSATKGNVARINLK